MADFLCWYSRDFRNQFHARENRWAARSVADNSAEEAAIEFRLQDAENTRRRCRETVWVQLLSDIGEYYVGPVVTVVVSKHEDSFMSQVLPLI